MNPRERLLTTLGKGKPDRVPMDLRRIHINLHNRDDLRAIDDPGHREIAERVYDETVGFVTVPSYVNRYLVTPPEAIEVVNEERRGGETFVTSHLDTPKGPLQAKIKINEESDTTWTEEYPVKSKSDIEKIASIPWRLPQKLSPPDEDDLPDYDPNRSVFDTRISSPFVCVAGMMEYEYFLKLCATDLDLIEELTEFCAERILEILDVLFAKDLIEYVWMGGCEWLTPPMGSPKLYDRLVQKWEEPLIKRIHEGGAFCHVHCHGNVASTLEKMVERGADFTEPVEPPPDGDIEFSQAKDLVDGAMVLGGNVEMRILSNGKEDEVERAVRKAFEGGKENMVLMPTESPISKMDPQMVANYHRLIDVWQKLSPC